MLGVDASIAVDQKCNRQSQNATVQRACLRRAHHDGIVHVELPRERADGVGAVVHGDADDLQAAAGELLLQFHEMGNFFTAEIAPGRPEIEQNNFAAIGGKPKIVSVELRKREIRRGKVLGCC